MDDRERARAALHSLGLVGSLNCDCASCRVRIDRVTAEFAAVRADERRAALEEAIEIVMLFGGTGNQRRSVRDRIRALIDGPQA